MAVANLEGTGQYSSPVIAALEDADFRAAYLAGDADFLPFIHNPGMTTGFMSPFTLGAINNYRVEHDAEQARKAHFKNAPSRLTGVFAFESLAVCEEVSRNWGWDVSTVERFKPQHVLKQARVNMEIVSLARSAYGRASLDSGTLEQLWRAYWAGVDDFSLELPSVDLKTREVHTVGATWEWIIDGALVHEDRVDSQSNA
jgi:hypothetical protein